MDLAYRSLPGCSSEKYLRTILETTQDGFIVIASNEKIVDANRAFYRMTGFSEEDLNWLCLDDLIPPDDRMSKEDRLRQLLKEGAYLFETKNMKKDGSAFNAEISASVLRRDPLIVMCFIRDITDRKMAEKTLLQSRDLMSFILEHNRSAIAIHDKNLRYMYVSRPYMEIFRVNEDIIGRYHYDVFPDLPPEIKDAHARVLQGEVVRSEENIFYDGDGNLQWMRWECRPWYENDGLIGGFVLYSEVITERKQMEQALNNEKEQFKTTLLSVGDGVISTDNRGAITVMNPIAEKLTGWTTKDAVGRRLDEVFRVIRESTGRSSDGYLKKVLETGKIIKLSNTLLLSKSGDEIPIEINAAPIKDSDGHSTGVVIVFRDFTERRAKQKQIEYLSFNDHLTGLYNRRYMEDAIKKHDVRKNLPLALMIIDVNGLKLTNDAFGHETGDKLLKKTADLIKRICRADDIVGRIGGDEFCILLPRTDANQAETIAGRIKTAASKLKLEPVLVSLAVGFAVKTSTEQDIKAVMVEADNIMYRDKIKHGRAMRSKTIDMILRHLDVNYAQEQVHIDRVSRYSEAIAEAMALSKREIQEIKTVGALHDIGKIMVPPQILNKTEKLTKNEWAIIKRHPEIGYQMLKSVDEYARFAEFVLYHHERWDGKGYPEGRSGTDIPLYSRIITVADAYEAMTAVRPYQETMTAGEAAAELLRCAGTQFDPDIVRIFLEKVLKFFLT